MSDNFSFLELYISIVTLLKFHDYKTSANFSSFLFTFIFTFEGSLVTNADMIPYVLGKTECDCEETKLSW